MQFKIHQRKSDKNNTEIYKKAVQFFADELLSKTKQNKLTLSIIIKKFKGKTATEFAEINQLSRYNYVITLNKEKPFHAIISSLAHEFIHLKQGVLGKLVMTGTGFKWNGKLYKSVDIDNNDEYFATAWEAEAYKLEVELTKKFFRKVIEFELKEFIST